MKAVRIGNRVKRLEYYDVKKATEEGLSNPYLVWRHDFKIKDVEIWGLEDGSVLLVSRSCKRLWNYR